MTAEHLDRLLKCDGDHFQVSLRDQSIAWRRDGYVGYLGSHLTEDALVWWMLTQLPDVALVSPNGSSKLWDCEDSRLERYNGRGMSPKFCVIEAYLQFKESK